jgi:hypothetical protein
MLHLIVMLSLTPGFSPVLLAPDSAKPFQRLNDDRMKAVKTAEPITSVLHLAQARC